MNKRQDIAKTDVIFLYADDRATIRQRYSQFDLREGLLLHILYFGRAIIPVNFVLANPKFDPLFLHRGEISELADIFRLIQSGHVIPLMFDDDFLVHHPNGSIFDYAKFALDQRILLPCPTDQWLMRAKLLEQFPFATIRGLRSAYRENFLGFLANQGIQRHYLPSITRSRLAFIEQLRRQTADLEHPTRSDTYKLTIDAPSVKFKRGLELIADAAYYAAFTDISGANPALPRLTRPALLPHYSYGPSPFLFTPEDEPVEVFAKAIPDFSHLSIDSIIEDLKDTPPRRKWLNAFKQRLDRTDYVDPMAEDLATAFGQFTNILVEYLGSTGRIRRQELLSREKKFFKQIRGYQIGSDFILVLGAGITTFEIIQGTMRGDPNLTSLASLVISTGAKLYIRSAAKRLESQRPTYGSTIPWLPTFTLIGKKRS